MLPLKTLMGAFLCALPAFIASYGAMLTFDLSAPVSAVLFWIVYMVAAFAYIHDQT